MSATPEQSMPRVFDAVQRSGLFDDCKTFADADPLQSPQWIEAEYLRLCPSPEFSLAGFVTEHFSLPPEIQPPITTTQSIEQYLADTWQQLQRSPDTPVAGSSLLPLPYPYVVPGGRFREIYYWDSYFTLLGLAANGHWPLVRNMVDNFAHLIETYGHIPNGNRRYYLSRSQPPLFALMVQFLAESFPAERFLQHYLPALLREYHFWMQGAETLGENSQTHRRVVWYRGVLLNRYWDDEARPRAESYREDLHLAEHSQSEPANLFRNIRAACETGWDFSSRWLRDPADLASCRTTELVPVDLNCIMVMVERVLARALTDAGDASQAQLIARRAEQRASLLRDAFFCRARGQFVDCELPAMTHSDKCSLATSWPLFAGIATDAQARAVANALTLEYLRPGGWVTTALNTGQQWDAPNGWAPLQWLAVEGLRRYGHQRAAAEGARRWLATNERCFDLTGQFYEKYDVEQPGQVASGGEYPVQLGFGWSNAVYILLRRWLDAAP